VHDFQIHLLPSLSARSKRHQGKSYLVDDQGAFLPSVSTVLNATKSREDREALQRWRQRVGTAESQRIAGQASRRGTSTHKQLRHYLIGEPLPCPEVARPYWESLQSVLNDIETVQLVEGAVFHYDLGYGGRVDCVATYKGVPCVLDWKTSDRPKETVDRLYDNPLQLAAYCGAVNHIYGEHGVHLKEAAIVVAIPDQEAEVFYFDAPTLRDYWQQWQERVARFHARRTG